MFWCFASWHKTLYLTKRSLHNHSVSTSIFRNAGNGNDIEGKTRSAFHTALITLDLHNMLGKIKSNDTVPNWWLFYKRTVFLLANPRHSVYPCIRRQALVYDLHILPMSVRLSQLLAKIVVALQHDTRPTSLNKTASWVQATAHLSCAQIHHIILQRIRILGYDLQNTVTREEWSFFGRESL